MTTDAIKEKIRQHLAKVTEDTAKKIAAAIGMKDYPSKVVAALSEMRTDAEVECNKKKGEGNDFWYWLCKASAAGSCVQESEKNETQATLPTTGEPLKKPHYNPDAVGFDAGKRVVAIAERNHKLIDEICAAIGYPEDEPIDQLPAYIIRKMQNGVSEMPTDKECCNAAKVVATTAGKEVADLRAKIDFLEANQAYRESVIADLHDQLGHARIQVAALNEQLMTSEEAVDVKDAASGYLVCTPKRKPAKLMNAASAVARAKSAAKSAGRSEVFALVLVGVATCNKIRVVKFKEREA